MRVLYDLSMRAYYLLILIASRGNRKAGAWLEGRRGLLDTVEQRMRGVTAERIWMHCASVGEFEQGRPVLEALRQQYPDMFIILTFFSPSGYELRKNYAGADLVTYLPLDTRRNADRFVSMLQPRLAIFVKYEHWYHHLKALKRAHVKVILISAIFRPSQPFFRPWGFFWRSMLTCYDEMFVQDQASKLLLIRIGLGEGATMAGDTRFDRVCGVADGFEELSVLHGLPDGQSVLVAGSTWPAEERLLAEFAHRHQELRIIIAPHELSAAGLADLESMFPQVVRWSRLQERLADGPEPEMHSWRTLLIDRIGLLSRLYKYGSFAYVGGGFHRAGIHNVLEAAVYGIPVIFGPEHRKAREALMMKEGGGAFVVNDAATLENTLRELCTDPVRRQQSGEFNRAFVRSHAGATAIVMAGIQRYLRSTS